MRTEKLSKEIKHLTYRIKGKEVKGKKTRVIRFYTKKGIKHHPTQIAEQYHTLSSGSYSRMWWVDGKQHCTAGPAEETYERCWQVQGKILLFAERRLQ